MSENQGQKLGQKFPPKPAFNQALMQRVGELRRHAGLTQREAAGALGLPLRTYQKFEYRSPLAPHLISPFAELVGVDERYLLTGE
jgi:transcriptional regulator with XRE-family HTH domain